MSNSTSTSPRGGSGDGADPAAAPDQSAPAPTAAATAPPPRPRLVGVDVARGLAVLGMFVIHVGLGWGLGADGANPLTDLVSGRAAALFAVLAGVSIALLSGGSAPVQGRAMGVALWRVVVRGLLVLPLGVGLTMLGTPVAVILAYYAAFFVLAVPLIDERWKVVAGTAAILAAAGPVVSFWLRSMIADGPLAGPAALVEAYDPMVALSGSGLLDLLVTGSYPALTWLPYVLAGLAVGRLDLTSLRVRAGLVATGTALAALGYGLSWVAMNPMGGRARLEAGYSAAAMADHGGYTSTAQAMAEGFSGTVPVNDWVWLLTALPHSGTPLELAGAGGVAIAVLGLCLLAEPVLRRVGYPLAAVGSLALTVYVGHVLLIWVAENGLWQGTPLQWVTDDLALTLLVGALGGATLWRLALGRGPLERPLHTVSSWAAKRIP
ncbi:heparan-alpha-glucosaminide N-acetyltransferase domain-containing protein [Streptomonospora halophila]|uniref:Heparan-alpha-glucosaminide N-acetyltransferase domain-containing protein n=1 Tax=Streptomonospora halophila TaxID=427369 RepID=A0ABP9GBE2_9ACTN